MAQNVTWPGSVKALLGLMVLVLAGNLYLLWRLAQQPLDRQPQSLPAATACADQARPASIYVPAYSHIYQNGLPVLMEVALSLHNTDPEGRITIERVDYFDSQGKLLRRFLQQPLIMEPLMSLEYLIEKADFAGGMGANFLISWRAAQGVTGPLAEALMTGGEPGQWHSFTSRGEQRGPRAC